MKKDNIFKAFLVLAILVGLYFSVKIVTPQPVINCNHSNREYSFDVTDDSISVYTEDDKLVGTVLIEGQLDSLIIMDNQ